MVDPSIDHCNADENDFKNGDGVATSNRALSLPSGPCVARVQRAAVGHGNAGRTKVIVSACARLLEGSAFL